jgi:hypothetical protein
VRTELFTDGAVKNAVVLAADWNKTLPAAPPKTFEVVPEVATFRFATCVVEETVNGAVPVAIVEVRFGTDTT